MIPYFKAFIDDDEINKVIEVFKGGWLTTGNINTSFEKNFLKTLDLTDCYSSTVNSNTAGLHLVLDSYKFPKGSEVIVPAMTFTACAAAIVYSGLKPVIVDCNEDNLIDASIIDKHITKQTVAVMVVHFAGKTADIDEINSLCRDKRIKVIEDCAHSLPSKYKDGAIIGSKGNPCVFSFYSNKTMTTGEGGMIVTNDKNLDILYKKKRSHGMNKNVMDRFTSASNKWEYDVDDLGYKYNLTDIAASIGIAQLQKLHKGQVLRSEIHQKYKSHLDSNILWMTSDADMKGMHSHHLFQIRSINDGLFREKLLKLFESNEIGYSIHYKPLNKLKMWKSYVKDNESFKNANFHFSRCISLPIYPEMPYSHIQKITEIINTAL